MEGLAVAIQRKEIRFPEGPIVQELLAYEYQYTRLGVRYSAAEGLHDDCVCALALAVQQRQHLPMPYDLIAVDDAPVQAVDDEERRQVAVQAVTDAIRDEGIFWPVRR